MNIVEINNLSKHFGNIVAYDDLSLTIKKGEVFGIGGYPLDWSPNFLKFAKDLFKENPECLELEEVLRNAEDALAEDNLADAALLMNSAVQSCRDLIAAKEDGLGWLPSPLRGVSTNE